MKKLKFQLYLNQDCQLAIRQKKCLIARGLQLAERNEMRPFVSLLPVARIVSRVQGTVTIRVVTCRVSWDKSNVKERHLHVVKAVLKSIALQAKGQVSPLRVPHTFGQTV